MTTCNRYQLDVKSQKLTLGLGVKNSMGNVYPVEKITLSQPNETVTEEKLRFGFQILGSFGPGLLTIGKYTGDGKIDWCVSFSCVTSSENQSTARELALEHHNESFLEKANFS